MTYREARERAGLTAAQAARLLGVSRAAVSHWELHGNPSVPMLRKMAELYGVSVDELISDAKSNATQNT